MAKTTYNALLEPRWIERSLAGLTETTIETIYAAAAGEWTTADFTHEADDCTYENASYCDGDNDECSTCKQAAADAEKAEGLAAQAMIDYRAGRLAEAADLAEKAASIESTWGDTATWGALADALAEAVELTEAA